MVRNTECFGYTLVELDLMGDEDTLRMRVSQGIDTQRAKHPLSLVLHNPKGNIAIV